MSTQNQILCYKVFSCVTFYPSQVTLKNFQPKVGNRYINFLIDTHLWQQSLLFLYLTLFFLLCSHFVLEKFVIWTGSGAPIVPYATHFTILSKKSVFWYAGPYIFLWSFSWAKYVFVWRENGVGTHFEQQFFSFTQHQVPFIGTV